MVDLEWEHRVRGAAFDFLRELQRAHPDVLPARPLQQGFEVDGHRIALLGSGPGIWKPAPLAAALSFMTTAPKADEEPPYEDEWLDETRVSYAYKGTDPDDWMNRAMRTAWEHQLPVVYLHGVSKGAYLAEFPVYITRDRPGELRVDLLIAADPLRGEPGIAVELDGRTYRAAPTRTRLHQQAFRLRVLGAYQERCAICALRHRGLLDAAHIVPDGEPDGLAVVSNGLALCKIHHAAYDQLFLGIRPDLVVEVNRELLEEEDGPMLRHGLQEMHRQRLRTVPRGRSRPDERRLEWRYERFRAGRSV
jgi:putative restriction endonuclease